MISTITLRKASDAGEVAGLILGSYPEHRVLAFHGDLGAGKTTLIKAFCRALGVEEGTSSPSFALVNEYVGEGGMRIHHFDLYRLKDTRELEDIGFEEYLDEGGYSFIEWPELAKDLFPQDTLHVRLEEGKGGVRRITLSRGE